jgi:3-hydroxy-9,10-secoandrosta-1,3,5(10)-triene-9,17-dione monooxygenase
MSLLEDVRRVTPHLAAHLDEDRQLRRLSDTTWRLLHESGILRALQPRRWGGHEAPMTEFADAVFEISRASPSAGWVAGVIGVHPWQLALFADAAQQEMWREDPATMHSSSYNPTGRAEKVDGGYRLTGRWSFSSGCDHCRAVNVGAVVGVGEIDGVGPQPEFRSFLLHREQYDIDDNWHVAGLQGTGSKDIVVANAFVPEHRTQSHLDYASGRPLPGWRENTAALYRLPFSVVFNSALAASILGSARGFVDLWVEHMRGRRLGPGLAAEDDPFAQRRLAEVLWSIDATMTLLRTDLVDLLLRAERGEAVTVQQRAQSRWHMTCGCDRVGEAIVELFRAASGRRIFLDHPLQRRFQDVQGGLGHAFMVPDPLARAVGGVALGARSPEYVL